MFPGMEYMELVAKASNNMNNLSMSNKNLVKDGNNKLDILISKSKDVNLNIDDTSKFIFIKKVKIRILGA